MASSERPHYQQFYNNPTANTSGNVVSAQQVQQQQMVQPNSAGPAVVVTQPLIIVTDEPQSMNAFILSLIGTIFFCFICGIPGMLLALKARLYTLENKLDHARLTVKIVWVFCGLALIFGILTWALVGSYIIRPYAYIM